MTKYLPFPPDSSQDIMVAISMAVEISSGGMENLVTKANKSFCNNFLSSASKLETEAKSTLNTCNRVYKPTPSGVWIDLSKYSEQC